MLTVVDADPCNVRDFLESQEHLSLRVACCCMCTQYAFKVYPLQSLIPPATLLHAHPMFNSSQHRGMPVMQRLLPATRQTPLGQAGVVRLVALWSLDIVVEIIQTIDIDYLTDGDEEDNTSPMEAMPPIQPSLHRHKLWKWWTSSSPCWMNATQGVHVVRCSDCWQMFPAPSPLLPCRVNGLLQELCLPPPPGVVSSHEFMHPAWTCLRCKPEA